MIRFRRGLICRNTRQIIAIIGPAGPCPNHAWSLYADGAAGHWIGERRANHIGRWSSCRRLRDAVRRCGSIDLALLRRLRAFPAAGCGAGRAPASRGAGQACAGRRRSPCRLHLQRRDDFKIAGCLPDRHGAGAASLDGHRADAHRSRAFDQRSADRIGAVTPGPDARITPSARSARNTATRWSARCARLTAQRSQPATTRLSDVLEHLNETSLSQLVHDHGNHKLDHRIRQASPD